jgi:ribosome biogenesis GTPase A
MPARLTDQTAALKLAMCDDIGVAAYDSQCIAAAFLDLLQELEPRSLDSYGPILKERYGFDLSQQSGEALLASLATQRFQSDQDRAAKRLLNDFRTGLLGSWALEWPPVVSAPMQP